MELKNLNPKILIVLASLLVGSLVQAAPAVTTAGVNVRTGPNARILTAVPRGTRIEVIGKRGNWSQVQLNNGRKGWIFSKYISQGNSNYRSSSNGATEGTACQNCLDKSVANPVREASQGIAAAAYSGQGPQCISNRLIAGAKSVIKSRYGNRTRGGGMCALGVRLALNRSKIWPGGGIGNAKDMIPGLQSMGFRNIKTSSMTPGNAPAGSILVYGKAQKRGCRGRGSTYGHVEIKENNNSYLYDARVSGHIQQLYEPACRPLIGVMVMGTTCKTCPSDLKRACGV